MLSILLTLYGDCKSVLSFVNAAIYTVACGIASGDSETYSGHWNL